MALIQPPGGKHFDLPNDWKAPTGLFSCHASDGGLGNDHGVAEGERQQDINEEENSSAVFCCEVGKTPDISKSDGSACCSQHVTDLPETSCGIVVLFIEFLPFVCYKNFGLLGQFLEDFLC